jgi:hypothetical protein
MRRVLNLLPLLLIISLFVRAQIPISRNITVSNQIAAETQSKILNALDTLLNHIGQGKAGTGETDPAGGALSLSVFSSIKGIQNLGSTPNFYKPELINLYAVANDRYFISVAFINGSAAENPLRAIINFVAAIHNDHVQFAIPLYELTRTWQIAKAGNVTYHYPDHINLARAKKFNQTNTRIAVKLRLAPEKLDFYLCDNYQEILRLLGYEYDSASAGKTDEGYGVDEGTIFSIRHNEDFSHDAFHYYAAKVRTTERNSAAEEGIAYSWGNAYYTDEQGEMITQKQLVSQLKQYLAQHAGASLLELFTKSPPIFPFRTKVRSLISSLVTDEVERRKGIQGVKALINCGKGDECYFSVVNSMIGINPGNFDAEVGRLLVVYR